MGWIDGLYTCEKCGRTDLTYPQADLHANGCCPTDERYRRTAAEEDALDYSAGIGAYSDDHADDDSDVD